MQIMLPSSFRNRYLQRVWTFLEPAMWISLVILMWGPLRRKVQKGWFLQCLCECMFIILLPVLLSVGTLCVLLSYKLLSLNNNNNNSYIS